MNDNKSRTSVRNGTGLAGLFAFFLQIFSPGPTLDFRPVGDTYQTEDSRVGDAVAYVTDSLPERALVPVGKNTREPVFKTRYRERSRFDGRGGIVDLRG